ncbi:prolyl oligopeptidase [Entomortierella parvispora]|uniref:Prolyl endopeptidase n=1 Tax=Entomortierella parvispora TaxID=205924 RepID=A0A9P3H8F1_9FUNG|nr:prolyl oligopeptidase [Entomortierella parvispora]
MVNTSPISSLDGGIVYPYVRRTAVTYTQHGVTVADPYSWLEDPHSEETKAFISAQNKIASQFMDKFEDKQSFNERLTELFNYERFGTPFKRGSHYYYFHNSGLQSQRVLYQQDTLESEPRVFLDPNTLEADGTASMRTHKFSHSGELYAYTISKSGSDWCTIYVQDCNGNKLNDIIEWVKFTQIVFTHDDKGFYYSSFEKPDVDAVKLGTETASNIHQRLFYHRIGTLQSEDILVFFDPENPLYKPAAKITDDGRYILLSIRKDSYPARKLYFGDLEAAGNAIITQEYEWNKVVDDFEALYDYLANDDTLFYFWTNSDAPRNKIVKYDLAHPEKGFIDLVPQTEDVLVDAVVVDSNKLVLSYMRDVKDIAVVHDLSSGQFLYQIPLPVGTLGDIVGLRETKEFFISFSSYLTPSSIYRYDFGIEDQEKRLSIFRKAIVKNFDNTLFETKQVFYESKDGTKIPMFVTHRKDLVFDGNNPTLLSGYGGFGISRKAAYSPSYIIFMQHFGGVVAVANLRGGGEYGQDWHKAGTKLNKQNVFDDFQYAAKYLIHEKYTQPAKLAITGGSNGGLLVAACVNQAPELFGAAVASVGVLDMLRFHKFTIGHAWQSDYGYPDDNAEDFHNNHKYSPLHNVHKSMPYPAFALFTSDHDDRVVPLHSFKYIAELQYTAGPLTKNPLVIRIETNAGHGSGKPIAKRIEETTDKFAFIASSIGADWIN